MKISNDELTKLSKEELIKMLLEQQNSFDLEYEKLETKVTERVTKEVTKEITEKVTKEITDKVTKEVTEKLTREFHIQMNDILRKLAEKNLTIKRYNKELYDTKSEKAPSINVINEAEKKKTGRKQGSKNFEQIDLEALVEKVTIVDIDVKNCPECNTELVKFGEDISYKIYRKPACFYVEKIVTPKYKCPIDGTIYQQVSDRVFPHSPLTPELAASIVDSKLGLGIPLDRQSRYLSKHGFPFSTQTLSNWFMESAKLLSPLYDKLKDTLVNTSCNCINADETPLKVLDNNKENRKKSYVFCYLSSYYEHPIYLYDFETTREGVHAQNILKGFKGYVMCDGYAGYEALKSQGIKLSRCFVHARREFMKCFKGMNDEDAKKTKAYHVYELFQEIFKLESECSEMNPDEIKMYRNSEVYKASLNDLYDYVCSLNPEEKTQLYKACKYLKKAWNDMLSILEDGHLELTNNAAERAIKPFVIDRKNFLFCKTENGAEATAKLFSIIQTAQANMLIPDQYLCYVMNNIGKFPTDDLLPWSESIPEKLKIHKKDLEQRRD